MNLQTMQTKVKFLTDRRGKRTHAILPIRQYQDLLEDLFDNALADSREHEGTVLKMQLGSKAYREWVGSDNDLYDEVFKGEV